MKKSSPEHAHDRHRTKHYRFVEYMAFIVSALVLVVIGMWTYGHQHQALRQQNHGISDDFIEQSVTPRVSSTNHITFSLPPLPSDEQIHAIINKVFVQTCDGCTQQPLECLTQYRIDKRLVRAPGYEYLAVDVQTGSATHPATYTVIMDIHNDYAVVRHSGSVNNAVCKKWPQKKNTRNVLVPGTDTTKGSFLSVTSSKE